MAIRMSGLISGLDTESIVGALMSAQSLKKTKIEQKKTKLEWTQTKWDDLNTKLKKLYTEQVSKLQLSTAYKSKKATVSDTNVASVTASAKAANGSYTLEVNSVAKTQYLTGAKITKNNESITSVNTKIKDVDGASSLVGKVIEVTAGEKSTQIEITENMTLNEFASALKNAGLNASFDTDQSRFFISSKDSGTKNAFSIKSFSSDEISAQNDLKSAISYSAMNETEKASVDEAIQMLRSSGTSGSDYDSALEKIANAAYSAKEREATQNAETYMKAQIFAANYKDKLQNVKDNNTEIKSQFFDDGGKVLTDLDTSYREAWNKLSEATKNSDDFKNKYGSDVESYVTAKAQEDYEAAVVKQAVADTNTYAEEQVKTEENQNKVQSLVATGASKDDMVQAITDAAGGDAEVEKLALKQYYGSDSESAVSGFSAKAATASDLMTELGADGSSGTEGAVYAYAKIDPSDRESDTSSLTLIGLMDVSKGDTDTDTSDSSYSGAVLMAAADSEIILNGAKMTSSATSVSANGLTISLTSTTDKPITFSVSTDVDAIYDTIKTALKEYNSVVKEMYDDYNASSAKGYDPLTSEQKDAMTDEEVELWEKKIKDSLLRSDTTLNSIMQSMRSAMQKQVEYDGKKYSLSSFGIMTSTDYLEGGQYHIYGDTDDSVYSDQEDKLKKALQEDPDAVVTVMTGIFSNLRTVMSEKMAKTKISSSQTFYNDVKIKDDISSYKSQIDDWEDRLQDMEDAYYKKFSAMETAMAKLQSQQTSLGNLFGNS